MRPGVGDGEASVELLDRGIGFDDEAEARVFGTFFRSDSARRAADGLGIGLALARMIIDALGGRIWAASRDGGGAIVGFALHVAAGSDSPD